MVACGVEYVIVIYLLSVCILEKYSRVMRLYVNTAQCYFSCIALRAVVLTAELLVIIAHSAGQVAWVDRGRSRTCCYVYSALDGYLLIFFAV